MPLRRTRSAKAALTVTTAAAALAAVGAHAHMEMSSPSPRRHPKNPGPRGEIDYDYPTPLRSIAEFPCKRYPAQQPVLTVAAGSSVAMTLSGGAPHDGGHCQAALSYDGDKTWVVLDLLVRDCMRYKTPHVIQVPIPAGAPAGRATFAWTWINAVGNREYYMNCADIAITNSNPTPAGFSGPELVVANLEGYPTLPEFPGDLPDGRAIFAKRRTVVVSPKGQMTITGVPAGNQQLDGNRRTGAPTPPPALTTPARPPVAALPPQAAPVRSTPPPTQGGAAPSPPSAVEPDTPCVPSAYDYGYGNVGSRRCGTTGNPRPSTPTRGSGGDSAETACSIGQLACGANGTVFRQCVHGKWVDRAVAAGTVCVESNGSVHLAHASK